MDNKSTIMDITRSLLALTLLLSWPGLSRADNNCIIRESMTSKNNGTIDTKKNLKKDVVLLSEGQRSCLVTFDAQVSGRWHSAFGEHEWDGNMPSDKMCQIAESNAIRDLQKTVGPTQVASTQRLECHDDPASTKTKTTQIGDIINGITQVQISPNYPNAFWYRGAKCYYFTDLEWAENKINNFNGIGCIIDKKSNKLVVVDKF